MERLLKVIRAIKSDFERTGYICKDHEGKPFFGEIRVALNDGKIIHTKNKSNGDLIEVTESIKL